MAGAVTAAVAIGGAVGAVVDVSGRAQTPAAPENTPSPQHSPSAPHSPRSGPAGTATATPSSGATRRYTHPPFSSRPSPSPTP
jgi:hypothetical protein